VLAIKPDAAEPTLALAAGLFAQGASERSEALELAVAHMVRTGERDPRSAAASAVPFLNLFGIVAGGALLAATAASQDQSEGETETFDCQGGHQDVDHQTFSPDREYAICASAIVAKGIGRPRHQHQQESPTV
jgi:hypothetical protein